MSNIVEAELYSLLPADRKINVRVPVYKLSGVLRRPTGQPAPAAQRGYGGLGVAGVPLTAREQRQGLRSYKAPRLDRYVIRDQCRSLFLTTCKDADKLSQSGRPRIENGNDKRICCNQEFIPTLIFNHFAVSLS